MIMVLKHSGVCATVNRKIVDVENGEEAAGSTSFADQILEVLEERDSKWILGLITYNLVIIYYLRSWVTSTNSIALTAYVNTIFFNVFALLVCLVSIWVEQNGPENRELRKEAQSGSILGDRSGSVSSPSSQYRRGFAARLLHLSLGKVDRSIEPRSKTPREDGNGIGNTEIAVTGTPKDGGLERKSISVLGLEKYEVLALLVSSCLSLVAGFLVALELVARLTDQPNIHTGRLGLGALIGFLAHLGTVIGYPDAGLSHVVCKALPCPTVRGCNPILVGNAVGAVILSGTHLVIDIWAVHITDTAAAFAVIALTATSMLPLAFYTSNVILQKLPRHMSDQLDKCIREALVVDGVVEFRNERFWTKSFGKLAGTVQVRIRRNANEDHVLENVVERLSRIVSTLTVREFRDPRAGDVRADRSPEYYINEILSGDETPRPANQLDCEFKDVEVMRIEDILDSRPEAFAGEPKKMNDKLLASSRGTDPRSANRASEIVAGTVTLYKNDNVRVKDHLYRGDVTNKNAFLYGTKLDLKKFENISVINRSILTAI